MATPTISPVAGTYNVNQSVTITDGTAGASIHYTTNGDTPTGSSTLYSGAFTVSANTTVKAIATKSQMNDSSVASNAYILQAVTPVMSPTGGTKTADTSVTLSTTTSGATIYYTTDGSTPTTSSSVYSTAIVVTGQGTVENIKAIAAKSGWTSSGTASETYTINYPVVSTPSISPSSGPYSTAPFVSITTSTSGASIYYTTDGSTPTTSSTLYIGSFQIVGSATVKAIAVKSQMQNSVVASNTYTLTVVTPVMSPASATYTVDQYVSITTTTAGATIYYTMDGTTPTTSSSVYSTPLAVTGNGTNQTIKALAVKSGWTNSAIASQSYIIGYLTVATPSISVAAGTYNNNQSVTITDSTSGASIYYTTNGTTPTTSSALYSGAITVSSSMTLQAIATKTQMLNSVVASRAYVLQAATPTISPAAGAVESGTAVTLTTATTGANIYYTIDGSTPTSSSSLYNSGSKPTVTVALTLKAVAIKSGYSNSAVASTSYTVVVPLMVSHFAGNPYGSSSGWADGTGNAARFNGPLGITSDGTNLYVADYNNTIRKIVIATGEVTTLAGNPVAYGEDDGIGAAATFNYLRDITIDASGTNLYVTQSGCIRKIVIATREVTTFAGFCGYGGYTDGIGAAARFNNPRGITIDTAGTNLYVTDVAAIRKIVIATGEVTTFAGLAGVAGTSGFADGTGIAARFNNPHGITSDGTNFYVADESNNKIRQIVIATGVVTTLANVAATRITNDGTNLYVSYSNNTVSKIVITTGVVTTLAGAAYQYGSTDGTGAAARFRSPYGITSVGTNVYVTEQGNNTIRKIDVSTGAVTTIAGASSDEVSGSADGTGAAARFNSPKGMVSDGTNLYVTDMSNSTIRKAVISSGVVTTFAGTAGNYGSTDGTGAAASFGAPRGITTDGTNLYVVDYDYHNVRKIVIATGVVTTFAGSTTGISGYTNATGTAARFNLPVDITTDGTNLYVVDSGNNNIRKIVISSGVVTTFVGSATGAAGNSNGTGTAARLNGPLGITSAGANLYVSDSGNYVIRKIVISTGVVTTFVGTGTQEYLDATGTAAKIYCPSGIASDGTNLYFLEYCWYTIRKIVISTGVVTTFAGQGLASTAGNTDGILSGATLFDDPSMITAVAGKLFISEYGGHNIRKIE